MVKINNFSAWIQIDGTPLPEHQISYSRDGKQVTCWIPSEAGKAFAIGVQDEVRSFSIASSVHVDGMRCPGGKIILSKKEQPRGKSSAIQDGVRVAGDLYRPFVFSNVTLTEEEAGMSIAQSPEIGDIKVVLEECKVRERSAGSYHPYQLPSLLVNERAKKGIVHGTQLGNEVRCERKTAMKTTTLRTVATFVFRYRPLAVLQADGIATAGKRQDPVRVASSSNGIIDLSVKEEETHSRPKRNTRRSTTRPSETPTVKTEVKSERSMTFNTDIIDLTI